MFGRERETIDQAFAGDVVGLVGHTDFRIGDTLAEDPSVVYREIPRSTPECFAWLQGPSTAQFKRFREGLDQLLQEGVVQSFSIKDSSQRVPLLGAVGPLQFEVVQYRMQTEYGAESRLEPAPWKVVRWAVTDTSAPIDDSALPTGARLGFDVWGLDHEGYSRSTRTEGNSDIACGVEDLKAGVAFYGSLVDPETQASIWPKSPTALAPQMQAPVLGLYGEADQGIPVADVKEMEAALKAGLRKDGKGLLLPVSRGIARAEKPGLAAAELRDEILDVKRSWMRM